MEDQKELVKIVVDLPEPDFGVGGEGLWAKPLGNDLYEIHNSPWHTLEINYLDTVKAIAPSDDKKPVFIEVAKRGGHRSIHIYFLEEEDDTEKKSILNGINALGATYENCNSRLYAIDLEAHIDFDAVIQYLRQYKDRQILESRYAAQPQPKGTLEAVH